MRQGPHQVGKAGPVGRRALVGTSGGAWAIGTNVLHTVWRPRPRSPTNGRHLDHLTGGVCTTMIPRPDSALSGFLLIRNWRRRNYMWHCLLHHKKLIDLYAMKAGSLCLHVTGSTWRPSYDILWLKTNQSCDDNQTLHKIIQGTFLFHLSEANLSFTNTFLLNKMWKSLFCEQSSYTTLSSLLETNY